MMDDEYINAWTALVLATHFEHVLVSEFAQAVEMPSRRAWLEFVQILLAVVPNADFPAGRVWLQIGAWLDQNFEDMPAVSAIARYWGKQVRLREDDAGVR